MAQRSAFQLRSDRLRRFPINPGVILTPEDGTSCPRVFRYGAQQQSLTWWSHHSRPGRGSHTYSSERRLLLAGLRESKRKVRKLSDYPIERGARGWVMGTLRESGWGLNLEDSTNNQGRWVEPGPSFSFKIPAGEARLRFDFS